MLLFLISVWILGLFTGHVQSYESGSSSLLPHSCPLEEKSECGKDTTLTSLFDEDSDCHRSVQPEPELMTTSLNMSSGSAPASSHLSGQFSYSLHMGLFLDQFSLKAVTPEVELALGRRLWVKLEVRGIRAGPLGLRAEHCWATAEPASNASTRHTLISDGCPDPGEATVGVVSNGSSLTSVFSFRVFRFVSSRDVFLHCQARLCLQDQDCLPSCVSS